MKKIYSKVDSFVKREWFLLMVISAITIAFVLFEAFGSTQIIK